MRALDEVLQQVHLRLKQTLEQGECVVSFMRHKAQAARHWGKETDELFPVSQLYCIAVRQNTDVDAVPAVVHEGHVYIGGPNWFFRRRQLGEVGPPFRHLREPAEHAHPVGRLRKAIPPQRAKHGFAFRISQPTDMLVVEQLARIFTSGEHDGALSLCREDALLPRFLQPAMPGLRKLRLRGDVLQENHPIHDHVLHCAITGEWGLSYVDRAAASYDGEVTFRERGCVDVAVPLDPEEAAALRQSTDDSGAWRLDGDVQIEQHPAPEPAQAERMIEELFGVQVKVRLYPVLKTGASMYVRAGQPLFAPIPKAAWTKQDLMSKSEYPALVFLSVLKTMREQRGMRFVDLEWVEGYAEPFVELYPECRVQRVCYERYSNNRVFYIRGALEASVGGVTFNMRITAIRGEMLKRAQQRKVEAARLAREQALTQPLAPTLAEAINMVKPEDEATLVARKIQELQAKEATLESESTALQAKLEEEQSKALKRLEAALGGVRTELDDERTRLEQKYSAKFDALTNSVNEQLETLRRLNQSHQEQVERRRGVVAQQLNAWRSKLESTSVEAPVVTAPVAQPDITTEPAPVTLAGTQS